jgi:hypothetical protein
MMRLMHDYSSSFSRRGLFQYSIIAAVVLIAGSCMARPAKITEGAKDDSIFAARIHTAKMLKYDTLPIGERVVAMGKLFLGTPYVAGTLDVDSPHENLVVNLRGFDCVTFYENMLALARVIRSYHNPTRHNFEDELTFLRYRNGKRYGFHSRLHYTIDYFYNNQQKGVLKIVTREVGSQYARYDDRAIDFMTTHRGSYRQLARNDAEYAAMLEIESDIHARKAFYYIPKQYVADIEKNIQTGDILGITTNVPGLDCSHTGIAVRMPDGRIHFMHASSLMGQVIISPEPLADYLTHSTHQTGIIVNRPLEVVKSSSTTFQ